jgi:hypothetical protein
MAATFGAGFDLLSSIAGVAGDGGLAVPLFSPFH